MSEFKPDGRPTVVPRIITPDVSGLVAFIKRVFDAHGDYKIGAPVELRIADSLVMVSDGNGQREPMAAFLYVYVEDADRTYQSAVDMGASSIEKPVDTPYSDRRATIRDSWGNSGKSRP
jgi:PhnB protein